MQAPRDGSNATRKGSGLHSITGHINHPNSMLVEAKIVIQAAEMDRKRQKVANTEQEIADRDNWKRCNNAKDTCVCGYTPCILVTHKYCVHCDHNGVTKCVQRSRCSKQACIRKAGAATALLPPPQGKSAQRDKAKGNGKGRMYPRPAND